MDLGGGGERKTKADTLLQLCVACVRHTVRVPSLWRLSQQVGEREAGAGCGVCPVCHHLLGLEGEKLATHWVPVTQFYHVSSYRGLGKLLADK